MKRIITTIAALAISAMFIQAADAPAAPAKKHGDPEAQWKKIAGDKESVTKEEFVAASKNKEKAAETFDKKDTNHDGKLTKEEFLAHGKKAK